MCLTSIIFDYAVVIMTEIYFCSFPSLLGNMSGSVVIKGVERAKGIAQQYQGLDLLISSPEPYSATPASFWFVLLEAPLVYLFRQMSKINTFLKSSDVLTLRKKTWWNIFTLDCALFRIKLAENVQLRNWLDQTFCTLVYFNCKINSMNLLCTDSG